MKRLLLSALCAVPAFCIGQTLLYNDGAMIKVQAGATLYVEGGIQNTATGTIDNDGIIEVKGDFINAGIWEPSQPNTLKFTGNVISNVTSGNAQFQTVVIQKDATFNVNLIDHMTVNTLLNFNAAGASKLVLGTKHLKLGGGATVTGGDSDEFIVTGSTGKVKKFYNSAVPVDYPIGFNSSTYNPAIIAVTAGPNDTLSVRVGDHPTSDGNGFNGATIITTDVVDAVWDITESTAGGNTANVTLGWADTDELAGFNPLLNAVSRNDGTNGWDALHADLGPEVGNTRTRNGLTSYGAFAVGDKTVSNSLLVNAKVLLQGPYSTANSLMWDSLRTLASFPLTEPYSTLPTNPYVHKAYGGGETTTAGALNQPANGDDIVDWVVVELRSLSDSTTVLASKSALLQRDGDIVDLAGTGALSIQGVADANYILGVRHRNHLGIRTAASSALNNTVPVTQVDMSALATIYDDPAIAIPTTPMKLLTGSIYGLWAGDVNFNGSIVYNGGSSDRVVILNTVGQNTNSVPFPGYNRADVNMNGQSVYNGGLSDRVVILNNVGQNTNSVPMDAHNN